MNPTLPSDSVVLLTENAAKQAGELLAADPDGARKSLRVYVEEGGCSGMKYGLVFDEQRDGDAQAILFGIPVVVDAYSAPFLKGSTVDFADTLNNGGFKIVNPNARQSCGCGHSFEA